MASNDDGPERGVTRDRTSEDVHVVASFRPLEDDDGHPDLAGDQRDIRHLGRDAIRRALAVGAAVGIVVAMVIAIVVWFVSDASGTVMFTAAVAGGIFAAAVGGLWGAFSRLGLGEDWREAVTQHDPPPRVIDEASGRPTEEPAEAERLEARGAAEIHVLRHDEDGSPRTSDEGRTS
jgi:hypothetical protein